MNIEAGMSRNRITQMFTSVGAMAIELCAFCMKQVKHNKSMKAGI